MVWISGLSLSLGLGIGFRFELIGGWVALRWQWEAMRDRKRDLSFLYYFIV